MSSIYILREVMHHSKTYRRAGSSASPSHMPPAPLAWVSRAEDSATGRPAAVRPRREGDPASPPGVRVLPPKVREGLFS